ncbi:DNA binding ATP binding [Euphorbia peplus]|nr:DNA binding ATP binding [Euphorbia peplus]
MASGARDHIYHIRKTIFSIGGDVNPLASMLDNAVAYLSAELYTKDVHFLMELIQNAEDNEYPEGVDPSLEFVITSRDITATGALATLLIFNNEKGFSSKNIESICSVGNSTKKGNRKKGYIGEKGIGFKSVFLISAQPYIFSNGYQIRFNEKPCPQCNLGYVVPEWVEGTPSLSDIHKIYGSSSSFPATTIVLPLKPDKIKAVKQQLTSIQPEVLLFLSKIKCLSVREDNEDPVLNSVNEIAITKETNFVTRKNIDAESFTLHLAAEENGDMSRRECSYYIWKQKFPVKEENRVDRRKEMEQWTVTLAFPNAERLHNGMGLPGAYAFLPTEMVTNFPFIIQADFILSSSRETILVDNAWNQGILDCVPLAFVNALETLVKTAEDAPVSSLARMFEFLPINSSSYPSFNCVRESIKAMLADLSILPSESYMEQKFFHKPSEVGRIMPEFRNILYKARKEGVSIYSLSIDDWHVLHSSFDKPQYDEILNFLGVQSVDSQWYSKCMQSSNLVKGVCEATYVELLIFLADNWQAKFSCTDILKIPLIKYMVHDGSIYLCSVYDSAKGSFTLCSEIIFDKEPWLVDWSREFRCAENRFFLPRSTQQAIKLSSKTQLLWDWLLHQVKLTTCTVYDYARLILKSNLFNNDQKLAIAYAQFLYSSFCFEYLTEAEVGRLCSIMPLVDNYGTVGTKRNAVLVPANGSKWVQLIGSNPWRREGYVELGEEYTRPASFAGQSTKGNELLGFLKTHLGASDIPRISPPNSGIPTVSAPLTKQNVFLLLDWIRNLRRVGSLIPEKFLNCIKDGSWLRTTLNGSSVYRPPSQSFLLNSNKEDSHWGSIMQNGSVLVDIPLIDQSYYGDAIYGYKEELKTIGVMLDHGQACEFIGDRLMASAASSSLTRSNVISMLSFIRFLRKSLLSPEKFIRSIRGGSWLWTVHGKRSSPMGSVLYDEKWEIAKQISDIPFIDLQHYGDEILGFKEELELLGVIVGFQSNYQLVVKYLKWPSTICLSNEAFLLILECIRQCTSVEKLVNSCKGTACLKTNLGYKSSDKCFLSRSEWGCLLDVFGDVPIIDHNFYGSITLSYTQELRKLGVKLDFEDAQEVFMHTFKYRASRSTITKENGLSFLSCYKKLCQTKLKFSTNDRNSIRELRWLKTRLGDYRSPQECILFGPKWEAISSVTLLPVIDDSEDCYGKSIHEYRKELKNVGVVDDFKEGFEFVISCVYFPLDTSSIAPESVLSLLQCIHKYLEKHTSLPEKFMKKVSVKWLKTQCGYRAPGNCSLFDSKWGECLKQTDGPFIDEEFYGSTIISYKEELRAIGVIVDAEKGSLLLANHLDFHSELASIIRIYIFLRENKWKPEVESANRIWVPSGSEDGKWANPEECVLHDKDGLFGSRFNVLDKHYESGLLSFFSTAFSLKVSPSIDDYCQLWNDWGSEGHKFTHVECCAFWSCFTKHTSSKYEAILANDLKKLPVSSVSGEILLFNKEDVFIGDDLQLKDLFDKFAPQPMFVWYPHPSVRALPSNKLLEVYKKIGVRTISECVEMEQLSLQDGVQLKQVKSSDIMIGKEMVRLILGFLAHPDVNMEAQSRHESVKWLLNLTIYETMEPINVRYSITLSSGEIVNPSSCRMLRWEKEKFEFYTQKMDSAGGKKNLIEYATYFSQIIAEGVLWEKEDSIFRLSELIKLAFLLNFDEEAVKYLMQSQNLQIFVEDDEFLSSVFPSIVEPC